MLRRTSQDRMNIFIGTEESGCNWIGMVTRFLSCVPSFPGFHGLYENDLLIEKQAIISPLIPDSSSSLLERSAYI